MIVSVINTTELDRHEVQRTLRAVNRQLQEDFRRYWHTLVELRLEGWTGESLDPTRPFNLRGDAVIYLLGGQSTFNALGYHALTHQGLPYGFVFPALSDELDEPWSVTLSHEALELALDPEVNRLVRGPHPDPDEDGRIVYHWYELCDAVQGDTYTIDGIAVSNFLLPLYFTESEEHVNHNDFLGTDVPSFGVRPGGYVGFYDPLTGDEATYHAPTDRAAVERLTKKADFTNANRRDRRGGDYDFLNDPRFVSCDGVSFELRADGTDLLEAARRIVGDSMRGRWRIRPCAGDSHEFDALPPAGALLCFSEAWNAARNIEQDSAVVYAEPSFTFPIPGELDDSALFPARASSPSEDNAAGTERHSWALEQCNIHAAWEMFADSDVKPAGDILIGHPDSGFVEHPQLDLSRVRLDVDRDFLDDDLETRTRNSKHGSHGLATASVIISPTENAEDAVHGAAPHARLLPLRVTKPALLPSPVLFSGGMRRLRDAIDYAIAQRCQVISISLGGFKHKGLHKALRRAQEAGVIVCAAAGNKVGFVVSPASYPETIAVAGSNISRGAWNGSCRGKAVDITAPAESVWRATVSKGGALESQRGHGTSFATALLAGIAALWLSYHRSELTNYENTQIPQIFRQLLRDTASSEHELPNQGFGAGIVNAGELLRAPLPETASLRAAAMADQPSLRGGAPLSIDERESTCAETLKAMIHCSGLAPPPRSLA